MPRYFFHVFDGSHLLDHAGTELPDLKTARREALEMAAVLIESADRREHLGEEWRIEVVNKSDTLLFQMKFLVTESEALVPFFPVAGKTREDAYDDVE